MPFGVGKKIEPHKSGSVTGLNQSGSWQRKHLLQEPLATNGEIDFFTFGMD
jgi:hypothetical protein